MENSVSNGSSTLLSRPYSDRQLIVVIDDAVTYIVSEAMREPDHATAVDFVFAKVNEVINIVLYPIEALQEFVSALWRARESGIPIVQVGKSEAAQLQFPPGHPREKVVYVGHPTIPNVYYTIADFHRVAFEHKCKEAIDLLMHLGATSICVEHLHGWAEEFSGHLNLGLAGASTNAEGVANVARVKAGNLLFEAKLRGTTQPRLPEQLVWYPHEATWQTVARGRLEFGLQDFAICVTYHDDFGVHTGLKALALRAGLELGGKFEDHHATSWKVTGEFRTDC